jgi:hypothetical protein
MKMAIALTLGRNQFRTIAAGTLAGMIVGGAAALGLLVLFS